jgi:hypothetical protein
MVLGGPRFVGARESWGQGGHRQALQQSRGRSHEAHGADRPSARGGRAQGLAIDTTQRTRMGRCPLARASLL